MATDAPHTLQQTNSSDPLAEMAAVLEPSRTIVFKQAGGEEVRFHLFEPAGSEAGAQGDQRRACFLTMHGGGWGGGNARRFYPFASHFAKLGMLGISLEYRLMKAGKTTVFDCVKDGRSAVRYLRAHTEDLGIDPRKIFVSGGSAGGHIAAGTALFEGIDEVGEDTGVSPAPDALVLYYPVIDTSAEGYGHAKCGPRWRELSPLHRVRPGLPTTLVFHGTGDTVTPFNGAKLFHQAMLDAGNRCELVTYEGGRHGYLLYDRAVFEDVMRRTEQFLASATEI